MEFCCILCGKSLFCGELDKAYCLEWSLIQAKRKGEMTINKNVISLLCPDRQDYF